MKCTYGHWICKYWQQFQKIYVVSQSRATGLGPCSPAAADTKSHQLGFIILAFSTIFWLISDNGKSGGKRVLNRLNSGAKNWVFCNLVQFLAIALEVCKRDFPERYHGVWCEETRLATDCGSVTKASSERRQLG